MLRVCLISLFTTFAFLVCYSLLLAVKGTVNEKRTLIFLSFFSIDGVVNTTL